MPDQLAAILAAHRLADPFKGPLAFPDDNGEMYTRFSRLHERLAEVLEAIGIDTVRLHDLRHEYASKYLEAGGNISDLQKNLGHASIATTQIYVHAADEHRIREAQRMKFEAPAQATVTNIKNG